MTDVCVILEVGVSFCLFLLPGLCLFMNVSGDGEAEWLSAAVPQQFRHLE